jgi:hypothetical protein
MALDKCILKPSPFGKGNPDLWQLKYDVKDGRFLRIFGDFAKLIGRSEKACEEAAEQTDTDYQQFVAEAEGDYLEELIGASFIVLQTKIRRVTSSALAFRKAMLAEHQIDICELSNTKQIHKVSGDSYKRKRASLVQLIWDVGNYYKHRDEWPVEVWREKSASKKEASSVEHGRQTRRSVQKVGIVQFSTGNMFTAYQFFDIYPYAKCEQLAHKVQSWADQVYQTAVESLKRSVSARGG